MKKKIKVLQVIPRLGYGGAETGCYDLGHFLAEMINKLPFIGVALGIIMIYWLFPDVVGDKKNSLEKQDRS